jgi:tRNA(Ile)-lysidine synthase
MNLLQRFEDFVKREQLFGRNDMLLLAVSGGVDSVVLTHLCHAAGYPFAIAHCNFGLRGAESDRDEAFVRQLAQQYDVPFLLQRFDTAEYATLYGTGIQETARNLRYRWFYDLLENHQQPALQWLLTAHHADDQVETLLMNFVKGTGIAGLRGMVPRQQQTIRPLLFARRTEIEAWAKEQQLAFVEDSSNSSDAYSRNFLRHQVLPLIKEKYPQAEENIIASAGRYRDVETLYREVLAAKQSRLLEYKDGEWWLPVRKLAKEKAAATILYEMVKPFNFTSAQTPDLVQLLQAQSGKYVQSTTHRVLKNRNWLIIAPLAPSQNRHVLIEDGDSKVVFEQGLLIIEKLASPPATLTAGAEMALLNAAHVKYPLLLRRVKTGDYFYPLGMKKKKKLARFFIDLKLSKNQKEKVWVLESDRKILWVIGLRIDERVKITPATAGVIRFLFAPATT